MQIHLSDISTEKINGTSQNGSRSKLLHCEAIFSTETGGSHESHIEAGFTDSFVDVRRGGGGRQDRR
jgi:hypothetical protein